LSLATMDYLSNGEKIVRIELGHWALAQQISERSRSNLHRLMLALTESRDSRNQRDILTLLRQNPGGLTVRDFCRRMTAYASDIRGALDILLDSGEIEEIEHHPTTGRPTKVYKTAGESVTP
jgi:predicted ArsR family transcriptional regulator